MDTCAERGISVCSNGCETYGRQGAKVSEIKKAAVPMFFVLAVLISWLPGLTGGSGFMPIGIISSVLFLRFSNWR
jgi:hypothetical protein